MPVSKKEFSPCPIDAMLSVIDGRWKGTILWRLLDGPLRTSELRRLIPEITERMLIRHLRELVEDGILLREEKSTLPRHVSYSISAYGMTLAPALERMCEWGRSHLDRLSHSSSARPSAALNPIAAATKTTAPALTARLSVPSSSPEDSIASGRRRRSTRTRQS
jgi:DNA-binding HxlR family transcriptional regulator